MRYANVNMQERLQGSGAGRSAHCLCTGIPLSGLQQVVSHDARDAGARGDGAGAATILGATHAVLGGGEVVVK